MGGGLKILLKYIRLKENIGGLNKNPALQGDSGVIDLGGVGLEIFISILREAQGKP